MLIAGGTGDGGVFASAEAWDPVVLVSSALRDGLNDARTGHTATLLPSGDVLIVGGVNASGPLGTVERFEPGASTFSRETLRLRVARAHHSATLLPSGGVLIWGGVNAAGTLIDGGELLDPVAGTSTVVADLPSVLAADATAPWLAGSEPADGARDVPLDATIALRVSEPARGETVTPDSVQLIGPGGVVPASAVPAEGGLLLVVTPAQPLARMTTYTVVANGVMDTAGLALPTTRVSFTTGRRATAEAHRRRRV